MRHMFKLAVLALSTFMVACSDPGPNKEEPKEENFHSLYSLTISPRSYVLQYFDIRNISLVEVEKEIEVGLYSWDLTGKFYHLICQLDKNKKRYDELCQKHGDMNFYQEIYNPAHYSGILYEGYPSVDYTDISIVSDAAWDEAHPAGSSLGDITFFEAESIYPFIKSGYKFDEDENKQIYPRAGLSDIKKMVSELESDDLILIGETFFIASSNTTIGGSRPYMGDFYEIANLSFPEPPTLSQVHNITVTLTADDGRVFEKTVQVSWE